MRLAQWILYGLCLLVFACGCGDSRAAKDIREYRKQGKFVAARDLALAELRESPQQMAVWRELAFTNLMLSRSANTSEDLFPLVVQSAMMCAALKEAKGKLNDKWGAAATMATSQLVTQSRRVLSRIDDSHRKVQELMEEKRQREMQMILPKEQRDRIQRDHDRLRLKAGTPPLVDPYEAREVVWQAGYLHELLTILPLRDKTASDASLKTIDDKLNGWPAFSELDESFITDVREKARADCRAALDAAVNDIRDHGCFTLEHILNADLRP